MGVVSKTVRVFISSTFRDMQAERDWLVKRVFPALRQRLEPRRIHVVDVDLRWGITREQADNDQVLGLCLQQIEECRPFFIGLLGQRYGWVPSSFPAEVGQRHGWTQHHSGKSVTELEILHGVLNDAAMRERALFCFRSNDFLRNIADPEQNRIYAEGPTDQELRELGPLQAGRKADGRRQQLGRLKNQIRALSPPLHLYDGYPCAWDPSAPDPATKRPGRVVRLAEFGKWILEALERAILDAPELREHLAAGHAESRLKLAEERDFHERFIESRTRVYIGRQKLQDEFPAFIASGGTRACLVSGPSGSGKSAALAKFCQLLTLTPPSLVAPRPAGSGSTTLICHFVGASPRSTGLRDLLGHLCAELQDVLKLDDELKQDSRELANQFRELLRKVSTDHRVVLVIDALNQLDEAENAHSLWWLPGQIPSTVRLIVSCIDDPGGPGQTALSAMRGRKPHELKVVPLNDDERLGIVREIPSVAAKTLDERQIQLLLANEATRNPLYLLVALEELRGFGSFEQLNQRIAQLPRMGDTLTAIFRQVIRRLGEDFNPATVRQVLTLLACARIGLSERELVDLIEGETVRVEESVGDLFPILRQLRPYLQPRGRLLDYFHRHLAKAAHEEFFQDDEAIRLDLHRKLAGYFRRRADPRADGGWAGETERPFLELPFHLARCQPDELAGILADFNWLQAKTDKHLVHELIQDYDAARRALPANAPPGPALELVSAALRLSARILTGDSTQLAGQLVGRLTKFNQPDILRILEGAGAWRRTAWLCPLRAHLETPEAPLLAVLGEHTATVVDALISPDGRTIISSCADHTTRLWDFDTFTVRGRIECGGSLELTRDGGCLFIRTQAGPLHELDLASGAPKRELDGDASEFRDRYNVMRTTPDGRALVLASPAQIAVYDLPAGRHETYLYRKPDQPVGAVSLSPTAAQVAYSLHTQWSVEPERMCFAAGTLMAEATYGHGNLPQMCLGIWDVEQKRESFQMPTPDWWIDELCFSNNGQFLASASMAGQLRLWDLAKRVPIWSVNAGDLITVIVFSSDDRTLFCAGNRGTIAAWDAQTGRLLFELDAHASMIEALSLDRSGRYLISASADLTVRVWDTARAARAGCRSSGVKNAVLGLAFGEDANRIVSVHRDGALNTWTADGSPGYTRSLLKPGEIIAMGSKVALSRNAERVAIQIYQESLAGPDKPMREGMFLRLTELLPSGEALEIRDKEAEKFVFTPDGKSLVARSANGLAVWNSATGERLQSIALDRAFLTYLAPGGDDGHVLAVSNENGLSRVALATGRSEHLLELPDTLVETVLSIDSGAKVALVPLHEDVDQEFPPEAAISLLDVSSKLISHKLAGHKGGVRALASNPAAQTLLSASDDQTVKLWALLDNRCIATWSGDTQPTSCALSPDGRVIAVGDKSGKVSVLRLVVPGDKRIPGRTFGRDSLLEQAHGRFAKGLWEAASTAYETALRSGCPLGEVAPRLAECLLNAHETLLPACGKRLEQLIRQLDQSGLPTLAAEIRDKIAQKQTPPRSGTKPKTRTPKAGEVTSTPLVRKPRRLSPARARQLFLIAYCLLLPLATYWLVTTDARAKKEAAGLIEQATNALRRQDYSQAEQFSRLALASAEKVGGAQPRSVLRAAALYHLAWAHCKQGNPELAIKEFTQSLSGLHDYPPGYERVLWSLAKSNLRLGKDEEARSGLLELDAVLSRHGWLADGRALGPKEIWRTTIEALGAKPQPGQDPLQAVVRAQLQVLENRPKSTNSAAGAKPTQ